MFSRIAPRYDALNRTLSLSFDRLWRRRTAQRFGEILERPDSRVLDLCCGTGDLTLALAREARRRGRINHQPVFGLDFAQPMLIRARRKSRRAHVTYLGGDVLQSPFPDQSFDLIVSSFGFRNLANYQAGLQEIYRLLRPGGWLGILEFCAEEIRMCGPIYKLYFRHILARIGGAVSGDQDAYKYLPLSVSKFPSPDTLAASMRDAGYAEVSYDKFTLGIVALHTGRRSR